MSITVRIPSAMRALTKEQSTVTINAKTAKEMIETLESEYPGIKDRICESDGKVRRFINIFINGEDIRFISGVESSIPDGAEVSIIPAIAGGTDGRAKIKKIKLELYFPSKLIKQPVIYTLSKKFNVVFNIRRARVTEEIGEMILELSGGKEEMEKALKWLKSQGVISKTLGGSKIEG